MTYGFIPPSFGGIDNHGGIINVKNYGAKGDGVTDDAVAIQAACDVAVVKGFAIFFPAGTYQIGAKITITGSPRIYMFGCGGSSIINHTAGSSLFSINFASTTNGIVMIKDLNLRGTGAGNALYIVGDTNATDSVLFTGLKIENFSVGIYLVTLQGNTDNPCIANCQFYDCNYGIRMTQTHDCTVTGCQIASCNYGVVAENNSVNICIASNNFDGNNITGISNGAAIVLNNASRSVVSANLIEDFTAAPSIVLTACDDIEIAGNYLYVPAAGIGISCTDDINNLNINGNLFNSSGNTTGRVINIPAGNRINISGNIFTSSESAAIVKMEGIQIANAATVAINDNVFNNLIAEAILLNTVIAGSVSNNVINNPSLDGVNSVIVLTNSSYINAIGNVASIDTAGNLKSVVEETGTSDYNTIALNKGRNATATVIVIGSNTTNVSNT